MAEPPLRRQWWLAVVAAVLAGMLVYDAAGLWAGAGLAALMLGGFASYSYLRARRPPKLREIYCLKCGERLTATARQCGSCGSASWSYKN